MLNDDNRHLWTLDGMSTLGRNYFVARLEALHTPLQEGLLTNTHVIHVGNHSYVTNSNKLFNKSDEEATEYFFYKMSALRNYAYENGTETMYDRYHNPAGTLDEVWERWEKNKKE